ncbi:hypothetical protein GGR58DRAFT_506775 [Xylaria digitata]|nr:hypothetical protein GGR58DRAFT_506775 [Xylaria digitata]
MHFATVTAAFGMLLASVPPALANPAGDAVARQTPVRICGSRFGLPIDAFYIGEKCKGNKYACDVSCQEIIQCFNGAFVVIASCNGFVCAGNNNGGASRECSVPPGWTSEARYIETGDGNT